MAFYQQVLGMEVVDLMRGRAAFLRGAKSANHHDLGLFAIGERGAAQKGPSIGLYHLAWEVEEIEELQTVRDALRDAGALSGASDHGSAKSVYGYDPDGIEFEVMWPVPREAWGDAETSAPTRPLDLEKEIARFGRPSTA